MNQRPVPRLFDQVVHAAFDGVLIGCTIAVFFAIIALTGHHA